MNRSLISVLVAGVAMFTAINASGQSSREPRPGKKPAGSSSLWLSSLDLRLLGQGYGRPGVDRAMEGTRLQIAGRPFKRGVATHAESVFTVALDGKATRFRAICGVDPALEVVSESSKRIGRDSFGSPTISSAG
jgi:hypothetical protein